MHDDTREGEFRIDPVFVANDPSALRVAMLADEGLMIAGDIMAKRYAEAGTLRRVLPAWRGPDFELNAVFPRGRVQSPKVRAFIDFLVEQLELDAVEEAVDAPGPPRARGRQARRAAPSP